MAYYASVAELRADGVTVEQASDVRLRELLAEATNYIDVVTRMWFQERSLTLKLNGTGRRTISLYIPIVEVTEVRLNGAVLDAALYVVYNRHWPDDRRNPRLVFPRATSTSIFADCDGGRVWTAGEQNVEIDGTFGYLDFEDPDYITPLLINKVCRKIVIKNLPKLADTEAVAESFTIAPGALKKETTDGHSYELSEGAGQAISGAAAADAFGLTGDMSIDSVLLKYSAMRPRYGEVV